MQRPTRRLTSGQLERHNRTLELLRDRGEISIEELAEMFGISAMTVHRDLDVLEERGLLRKVRGGAVSNTAAPPSVLALDQEASWRDRARVALPEKEAIAARAAERVERGMTVFIDDSTSCLPLVPHLARLTGVTVVTNSLSLLRVVVAAGLDVVLIGGTYRAEFDAAVGLLAQDAIGRLRPDIAFMSSPAVHEGVCYHPDQDSVLVKRAALSSSAERILLIDGSKFTRIAPYSFTRLDDFGLVVTDDGAPPEAYESHLPPDRIAVVKVPGRAAVGGEASGAASEAASEAAARAGGDGGAGGGPDD